MYWNSNFASACVAFFGLIETWDVLKCVDINVKTPNLARLIETWDVLKLPAFFAVIVSVARLIETWDVLK